MQDQRITRTCAHCNTAFLIKRSAAARGRGVFCGKACQVAASYLGKTCDVQGCGRAPSCRRLCGLHYQRFLKDLPLDTPVRLRGFPPLVRFMGYVDRNGLIPESRPDLGPCWIWIGARNGKDGYGSFRVTGQPTVAHRAGYQLIVGPIPEGLTLDHLCRNRRCVNPQHLEPVPFAVNVARGESPTAVNARKTHCPQGHPYDEINTMPRRRGGRNCRACRQKVWTP
jgi:hypothetical protein